VPGSKSATARALVLSALADGPGTITGALVARDSALMVAALRALGVAVDDSGPVWTVTPPERFTPGGRIDCGLAGTVLRFVPPLAALAAGSTRFEGDPALAGRPVGPLLDGLAQLGARVEGEAVPFSVAGPLTGGTATIDSAASSQFVSGLLLAGARCPEGLELRHDGAPIPSYPHVEMTVAALRARGVAVEAWRRRPARTPDGATADQPAWWRIAPSPIRALDAAIEPDLTTAAVFLAAALVARGRVTIPHWPAATTQPGAATPEILTAFGGQADYDAAAQTLTVSGDGTLTGADVDLHATSELTPVVAGLAALAAGRTTIRGVAHIRGHETDRLAALARNLTSLGGHCAETADGLVIEAARLHGGVWRTEGDHRLAHAGALIGLRVPGVELDDVGVVAKTMPGFADAWRGLLR
jgi:3-phosphoshikimate 1-carboxyvinyltransferase